MKIEQFRIQNYKSIQDSGWITADKVIAFIGKNEAGKTSVLRALSKLNPTDGKQYNGLKEFPRGRYSDEFSLNDWPCCTVKFVLDENDKAALSAIADFLATPTHVTVTRHYSGKLSWILDPNPEPPTISKQAAIKIIKSLRKTFEEIARQPQPKEEKDAKAAAEAEWNSTKQRAEEILTTILEDKAWEPEEESLRELRKKVLNMTPHDWARTPVQKDLDSIHEAADTLAQANLINDAEELLKERMPKFLFFSNYEMLHSSIFLPEFIQRSSTERDTPELRVQAAMFKHVGADINKLAQLSQATVTDTNDKTAIQKGEQKSDELEILADSAATTMTKKFAKWWQQKNHVFHYAFHGKYFRIWVSDTINASKIELEERSEGFRYFFSLYLLFLVEAKDNHRNCILLLDEPGLHLHGRAQEDLLKFFDKIAEENDSQLFYTTHSPFLVDGSRIDRLRAVTESPDGTTVSENIWPGDKDSLFPIQAALGYSVCQSLFLSKKQVLLEGPTEFLLLWAINHALPAADRLDPEITMIPVGGATNLSPFASLLKGHGIQFAAVIDGDVAGQKGRNAMAKIIPEALSRIITYAEIFHLNFPAELEDTIPADIYLTAVRSVYPKSIVSVPPTNTQATKHYASALQSQGIKFEKYEVIKSLIKLLQATETDQGLLGIGKTIFNKINGMFTT